MAVVAVAALNQGMLLPLLATLLEDEGISSSLNGLNAASLYLGILAVTPLCGPMVRRFGYRRVMVAGLMVTIFSLFSFPVWKGFSSWFLLRFLVGVGDCALQYAAQLWITSDSPRHLRGRRISLYGLAFGIGFGIGPLGINLLAWGDAVPFWVMGFLLCGVFFGVNRLKEAKPVILPGKERGRRKVPRIYRWAFVALCPAFVYGFLEASLSGSFPIYGLREGLDTAWVSVLISAFLYGSLLFQVPLGVLSDRWGRRLVLGGTCLFGAVGMASIPAVMGNAVLLLVLFTLIGGLLGSLYSLGLAYMADLLPQEYLPEANALANVHFAVGCMTGPYAGGLLIQSVGGGGLFYLISATLFTFVLLTVFQRKPAVRETSSHTESV
ncbi:hypothetical protein CHM34_12020 [Paludifilum halophilum]|uniref:Major facilitator superfamily (MFS) profile domain-containing protein n=1 Tax=Paludifilum halophilum TaxID=1642702 RepID=A0A235B487_9BACL|nr:hypothetical protein CHM34_12020 [Paludifilum halophilum]